VIRRVALLLFAACLLGGAATARAEGDDGEGRRRWKQGQEYYQKGRYIEAAKEFEAGFAVAPRPLFLLNIGHAYRRAQELVKAKAAYQKLLQLQPDLPQRAEVESYIRSIDDALVEVVEPFNPPPPAHAAPPPTPPVVSSPAPASADVPFAGALPDPTSAAQSAVASSPPAMVISEPTPPPADNGSRASVFTKPWFWVIVGAAVAGGVAVGVIALRPTTSCPGTLCIRE
jgi:hypothetical protein